MSAENQLIEIVKKSEVEEATAKTIIESFKPFYDEAVLIVDDAKSIVVTSEDQKAEMDKAHGYRMKLRAIRTSADKKRKELKEDSLKYGKAVQSVYNYIESAVSSVEGYLQEQEDYTKIQEEKKISATRAIRTNEISPFLAFIPEGIDFGTMSDEGFNKLLSGAKVLYHKDLDEKTEIARRAEEETKLKEKQNENDKLRKAELAEYSDVYSVLPYLGSMTESDYVLFRDDLKKKHEDKRIEKERVAKENELNTSRRNELEEYKDVIPAGTNFGTMSESEYEQTKESIIKVFTQKVEADYIIKTDADKKKKDEALRLEAEAKSKTTGDAEKLVEFINKVIDHYNKSKPEVESDKAKAILHDLSNHMSTIYFRVKGLAQDL